MKIINKIKVHFSNYCKREDKLMINLRKKNNNNNILLITMKNYNNKKSISWKKVFQISSKSTNKAVKSISQMILLQKEIQVR